MICLSFDTDHMDEARMREFLGTAPVPGIATFFCVQKYECIDSRVHEIAPHPFLGEGQEWEGTLAQARRDFPDATGCRPHSCTWSHALALRLAEQGYSYISCRDDFGRPDLRPYREIWGVWHLPIYYMDTLDLSAPRYWPQVGHEPFSLDLIDRSLNEEGLFVFGFHPIHLMLNSTSADAYLDRRDAFVAGADVAELRCPGFGAADFYEVLCERMEKVGEASLGMRNALSVLIEASAGPAPRRS